MMRNIKSCCFILISCFGFQIQAQDALFSQLHNSRNLLNPALLSIQNNALEIDLNYREQGGSISSSLPIRTFQVLANYSTSTFKVDRMTYGISVFSDRGGDGHVGGSLVQGHFGYLKKLTGTYSKIGAHYIGLGVSGGGGQRSVDGSKFWFGNQFNEEYNFIETGKDPREAALVQAQTLRSPIYYNIDAGITLYSEINESFSMSGGIGIFHLNGSNISLIEGQFERQKVRYGAHFGMVNKLSDLLTIVPRIQILRQGLSSSLMVGSELSTDNGDRNEFAMRFGFFLRGNSGVNGPGLDALIVTMNLNYNQFQFGLGYDITVSSLARYNSGRGGWELRTGYRFDSKSKKSGRIQSPDFKI